jgi:hypothetical protein
MTFDPQTSARAKTPFGDFEMNPTHLRTGVTKIGYAEETVDPGIAWAAALKVCGEALDVDDARLLLDALGLTEVRRG